MANQQNEQSDQLKAEFKEKFVAVVSDMAKNVQSDRRMLQLIGAIADTTLKQSNCRTWLELKGKMNTEDFNRFLSFYQDNGNVAHKRGDTKRSYAYEILAVSLIARTMQADEAIKRGDVILNGMIDQVVSIHRQEANVTQNAALNTLKL